MKLTIDFDSEEAQREIKKSIEAAIQSKISEMSFNALQQLVETKINNMTEEKIAKMFDKAIKNKVGHMATSDFISIARDQIQAILTEKFAQDVVLKQAGRLSIFLNLEGKD